MKIETALEKYLEKRGLESVASYYNSIGLNINPKISTVTINENGNYVINTLPSYLPFSTFKEPIYQFFKLIYGSNFSGIIIMFNGQYERL